MKRILVVDDSDNVRETIALLLERDFSVVKQAAGSSSLSLADVDQDIELLIIGVASAIATRSTGPSSLAPRRRFAVLFLVETKSVARSIEIQENVGCLVKPFNPYQLRAEVDRLLARPPSRPVSTGYARQSQSQQTQRYLQFPYLTRVAASLVHRFAMTRLPILISGEIGCGQERVARALHNLAVNPGPRLAMSAAEMTPDYLARREEEISVFRTDHSEPVSLLIEGVDRLSPSSQSLLLAFIEREAQRPDRCRILATSKTDLLERVYQTDFLESLYYQLAILNVTLNPLRERREDIPAIARWFALAYAKELGLGEISFAPAANDRLSSYLWFGNLHELEMVIARTLAVHRKTRLDAADLIFDFNLGQTLMELPELTAPVDLERSERESFKVSTDRIVAGPTQSNGAGKNGSSTPIPDLRVLIHELAHELKNPMVTIKTFAQLLTDRYQEESFRAHFQNVVDGDIQRIDDLLEIMIEFANFSQPHKIMVSLEEQVSSTLAEIDDQREERQLRLGWKEGDGNTKIVVDQAQFRYVMKNALVAVLFQAKIGSEIEMGIEKPGRLTISYVRDDGRAASMTQLLSASSALSDEVVLPLRILLARYLLERNGGEIRMNHAESDRETLEMDFLIA